MNPQPKLSFVSCVPIPVSVFCPQRRPLGKSTIALLCGLAMSVFFSGCAVIIPVTDLTPPVMTVEVVVKHWPSSTQDHYPTPAEGTSGLYKLIDFESLHAVATANDTDGGVFGVTLHADIGRPCDPPAPGSVNKSLPPQTNFDVMKKPGEEAAKGRVVSLDLTRFDIPPCPGPSAGGVQISIWAEAENFHSGKTVSKVFSFLLTQ